MAELGFQRSAKKCKEKFENVFKYHKRTKDGRASKSDGKSYRFFDQLEALENTSPNHFTPPPLRTHPPSAATTMAVPVNATTIPMPSHVTVPSACPIPLSVVPPKMVTVNPINSSSFQLSQPQLQPQLAGMNTSAPPPPPPHPLSNSTSSSTSSDEDIQRRRGRKRKWKDYLERLMRDVVQKQEELQKKFFDALEKRERDRTAREEAWRVQEMARINREHDLLVQERSMATAKDAAVIAFLQKVTGQTNLQIPQQPVMQAQPPENPPPPQQQIPPLPLPQPTLTPPPLPQPQQSSLPPPAPQSIAAATPAKTLEITSNRDNGGDDHISPS